MKVGKQPKRFGAPSDKFLAKSKPDLLTPPKTGPVHLYVDYKRPVPEGWTVIRSPEDLFTLLDSNSDVASRITHVSIDSYFGDDEITGVQVINRLADYFRDQDNFLPALQSIGLHSASRDKAILMDRLLADVLTTDRKNSFFVQWGTPRLDITKLPKGFYNAKPPIRYVDRTHKSAETSGS